MKLTATAVVAWTLAGFAALWAHAQQSALADAREQAEASRRLATAAAEAAVSRDVATADFTQSLPAAHRAEELALRALEVARSAAARHGVAWLRGQVQHPAAADDPALLPKVEIALALSGEYRALKAALDEIVQRTQPAVLRSLSLQRAAGNGPIGVDAAAVLVLPLRPRRAHTLEVRP